MAIQIIQFYRYSCYRGLGDPSYVKWVKGGGANATDPITITPGSSKSVFVTEIQFLAEDGFELDTGSGDAIRISPWGYTAPYEVDISSFNMLYAHCRKVEPVGPIIDGAEYHYLTLLFRPFIKVSDVEGTEFTIENTGGSSATVTADMEITVFSYTVDTADE
jgi:hypothetical protein